MSNLVKRAYYSLGRLHALKNKKISYLYKLAAYDEYRNDPIIRELYGDNPPDPRDLSSDSGAYQNAMLQARKAQDTLTPLSSIFESLKINRPLTAEQKLLLAAAGEREKQERLQKAMAELKAKVQVKTSSVRNRFINFLHKRAADSLEGYGQHAVQQYMPISKRRELSKAELEEVERESEKIIPRIFSSYSDKPFVNLSSPGWAGLAGGALGALGGGVLGGNLESTIRRNSGIAGAGVGATLGGTIGALMAYWSKQKVNNDILEIARRLPENATIRDYESDPLIQKERDRQQMNRQQSYLADAIRAIGDRDRFATNRIYNL